ncbi:YfhO family protein [Lachnospiraceae bacterium C1.1]|nr:YfhO family protein [Lachnospiraceae bacterium C1.1]
MLNKIKGIYAGLSKKKYAFFIEYSIVFTAVFLLCFWYFLYNHKSIIWEGDGLAQHYLALLYCSRFFKTIIGTFLSSHRLVIPMWDMSIGFGADIFTSMHYYGLGDPFTLLSAFIPEAHMDKFYCLLYFIKLYFAGLGAALFIKRHGAGKRPAIAGAMIYCFSVWGIFYCLHQYCFIVPLIWFPFVLMGVDNVLENKNPAGFILSLAAAAVSNFYFLYMIVVLAIGYAVFKYIVNEKKAEIRKILITVCRFLLFGAASMMIAAVILLPAVMTMMSSSRYSASVVVEPLYPLSYYLNYLKAFTGNTVPYSWTVYGYTPLAYLSIVTLFTIKGKYTKVKIATGVLIAFTLIPFAGYALNGFAYAANRWSWCLALLAAYVVALMIPYFEKLSRKQIIILTVSVLMYAFVTSVSFISRSKEGMSQTALLVAELLFIVLAVSSERKYNIRYLVAFLTVAGITVNAYYRFSEDGIDHGMKEYLGFSEANKILAEENADEITHGDEFYRIEEYDTPYQRNSSEIRGKYTTNYYLSMTGPYVPEFIMDIALNAERTYMYSNLDSRSILQALSSVKYLLVKEGSESKVPHGYHTTGESVESDDGKILAYEADNPLSLGYTYDSWVSEEDFEKMDPSERQEAMLNGVVLEESSFPKTDLDLKQKSVLKNIEENENIKIEDGKIYVAKDGASARLDIEETDNCELYFMITGLGFEEISNRDKYTDDEWKSLSPIERDEVKIQDISHTAEDNTNIAVSYGDIYRTFNYMNHRNIYYCGQDDYICNLGYIKESDGSEMRIHFKDAGVYDFSDIDVIAHSADDIEDGIEKLSEDMLENVEIGVNSISGNIDLDRGKILALSVPYSEGWTAYVDGKETELKCANDMYMAVELDAGEHDIYLSYETPYMRTGFILTVSGFVLFGLIEFIIMLKSLKTKASIY